MKVYEVTSPNEDFTKTYRRVELKEVEATEVVENGLHFYLTTLPGSTKPTHLPLDFFQPTRAQALQEIMENLQEEEEDFKKMTAQFEAMRESVMKILWSELQRKLHER